MIDGILKLCRCALGELRREPVDLSALSRATVEDLRRAEPDRQVRCTIADGLTVQGDRAMLTGVLNNLIDNAWKYSVGNPAAVITVSGWGGVRWISVSDNGAGFDPRHADKLFRPLERLHRQEEFAGLGVGLATGQLGQGACFRFSLPDREV